MKPYILFLFILLQSATFGQTTSILKTDFNTIYICVDTISYNQLFQSKYVKDTLLFCREAHTETNINSYTGKYLIGESATIEFFKPNSIEFFQPKIVNEIGAHLGDWGIEFKTRKIKILDKIIERAKLFKIRFDTSTTTTILDSFPIPWYKTISLKNTKNELAILEYQAGYLKNMGFTEKQVGESMTFKDFNTFLSNGKKYPRQFEMVKYIKMYANQNTIENILNFAKLNNLKRIGNQVTNGETTIEYVKVDSLPQFPIAEIEISLLNDQKYHLEKISQHLSIFVKGKKAKFVFKNN